MDGDLFKHEGPQDGMDGDLFKHEGPQAEWTEPCTGDPSNASAWVPATAAF
jgi:hypothetical protein